MNWNFIRGKLQYYFQYFPFTLNSFLCGLATWGAVRLLNNSTPKGETPSPFLPFIFIMGKIVLLFMAGLVALSVLSAFYCYIYYLYLKSVKHYELQVEFSIENKNGKQRLILNSKLDGAIRPLLGFVKARLFYDDNIYTDKFSLLSDKRKGNSIWRLSIMGKSHVLLPDIKEYDLKGGFVFFQDMLHLVSLAVPQPVAGHFYQPPILLNEKESEVYPKKTETLDVRIEQLRRIEGEYLNYKDFETGDDVRRIVWKVYAKSKELVVRTPELFEPYASHLYLYASFFGNVKTKWYQDGYLKEMLNYYKNCIWTVYDALSQKEWKLKLVPDLSFNIPENQPEEEKVARIISNSYWHKDKDLNQYFNPKNGSVLCISSLTDPVDLNNILEKCDATTMVYFVKLTKLFWQIAPIIIIKQILFMPPKNRLSKLRDRWLISPIRYYLLKKEKKLENILNKSSVSWGEI